MKSINKTLIGLSLLFLFTGCEPATISVYVETFKNLNFPVSQGEVQDSDSCMKSQLALWYREYDSFNKEEQSLVQSTLTRTTKTVLLKPSDIGQIIRGNAVKLSYYVRDCSRGPGNSCESVIIGSKMILDQRNLNGDKTKTYFSAEMNAIQVHVPIVEDQVVYDHYRTPSLAAYDRIERMDEEFHDARAKGTVQLNTQNAIASRRCGDLISIHELLDQLK